MILKAVEMVAINFAEWLSNNEWVKRKHGTHPNKIGKYWSNIHCEYKSVEELYEIFRLDEQKRLIEQKKTINENNTDKI